nr:putative mating-type 1-1-2 protein [Endoconidiophora laricicola]WRK65015.1 putative mating-type 1-1-2 protein [Endoconidiophora laricicola]
MSLQYRKIATHQLERDIPMCISPDTLHKLRDDIRVAYTVEQIIELIDTVMNTDSLRIIVLIRAMTKRIKTEFKNIVHHILNLWSLTATPFILDRDLNGGIALRGIRAIVFSIDVWASVRDQPCDKKYLELLVTSAWTCILATVIIVNWLWKQAATGVADKKELRESCSTSRTGTELFLRFTWDQVLPVPAVFRGMPGRRFGLRIGSTVAYDEDLSIVVGTKSFTGERIWRKPSYLHPITEVYGSAWGKFLRNRGQKLFFKGDYREKCFQSRPITFALPVLTTTWIDKLRQKYQHAQIQIEKIPFQRLAFGTGEEYPDVFGEIPTVETKISMKRLPIERPVGIGQANRYPISDLSGSVSLNLLETLMSCEPDELVSRPQEVDFLAPAHGEDILPDYLLVVKCRKFCPIPQRLE